MKVRTRLQLITTAGRDKKAITRTVNIRFDASPAIQREIKKHERLVARLAELMTWKPKEWAAYIKSNISDQQLASWVASVVWWRFDGEITELKTLSDKFDFRREHDDKELRDALDKLKIVDSDILDEAVAVLNRRKIQIKSDHSAQLLGSEVAE